MNLHLSVSLTYKEIFDDYNSFSISASLSQVPSRAALEVLGYVMAQQHTKERNIDMQVEILRMWLSRIPFAIRHKVEVTINKIQEESYRSNIYSGSFNFVNNVSSLKLIQEIFKNFNDEEEDNLTAEQELLLFKSYLYVSQQWVDEQEASMKGMDGKTKDDAAKFVMNMHMPYAEHFEFKDFRMQIIKAIYFFKFCEADPQFKDYLKIFITDRGLST